MPLIRTQVQQATLKIMYVVQDYHSSHRPPAHVLRAVPTSTSFLPFTVLESQAPAMPKHAIFLNKGQAGWHSCVPAHTDAFMTLLRSSAPQSHLRCTCSCRSHLARPVYSWTLSPLAQWPPSHSHVCVFLPGLRSLEPGIVLQIFKRMP